MFEGEIIAMRGRYLLLTVVITGIVIIAIAACTPVPVIGGWVGSIFGVYIYQRFDKTTKTTPKSGAIIGVLSGLLAGIVLSFSVTVFSDAEVVLEDWPVHLKGILKTEKIGLLGSEFYMYRTNRPGKVTDEKSAKVATA